MEREYDALPISELGEGAGYRRPMQPRRSQVTLESPALEVMTDLLRSSPATIRPQAPIEGANQFMISRGVRLLLVVDERDSGARRRDRDRRARREGDARGDWSAACGAASSRSATS